MSPFFLYPLLNLFSHIIIFLHSSGSLFVVLVASLISAAITHADIELLKQTHANGLCSHLHVQSAAPIVALLSIISSTSACGSHDPILHRNRKLKEMLFLRSTQSALLCVLLIDSQKLRHPLQRCYYSGSGTCRSGICFSFFHFSTTPRYRSVSSCDSSVGSELLSMVRSPLRPWLQFLIVHQLYRRNYSYCRNLRTK